MEVGMTSGNLYLKHNVLPEPLFNQWYAWSGLIYPPTAAMYIVNSHLKIMQSFISTPQIHVSALKNPKMIGGPFINYDPSRAGEIKELMDKTAKEQACLIELANAAKQLDEMLANEMEGLTLEPLYQKIPDPLRGYVELVYDLNNRPSFRFIEGLMYKSPYYNQASQSISLSLIEKDDRSFVFSTPRLKDEESLFLDIPFSDGRLNELFKMRETPQPYDVVKEMLEVKDQDDELFSKFFTDQSPNSNARYTGEGVRIRYFGHACLLIESKDVCILSDPVISYKVDSQIPRYSFADLPETIDYALITHAHQDHCMFETLLQLRHKIKNIITPKNNSGVLTDPSLKLALENIGFNNVREIDEMESISVQGGEIMGTPFLGEHADLNIRTKTAYFIRLEGRTVMFVADSNNLEPRLYEHIHKVIGDLDVIFIGMECDGAPLSWIYGSLLTKPLARKADQSRRLSGSDYPKAIEMIKQFNPKQVYVYAMGQEPWLTYVTSIQYTAESRPIIESNKLVQDCRERGVASEQLYGRKDIFLNRT
jgi:L-ascorbate metabolism protein UlaG (beta-lactamase superfamily)